MQRDNWASAQSGISGKFEQLSGRAFLSSGARRSAPAVELYYADAGREHGMAEGAELH